MFDTDFSRIGELFFREVGIKHDEISLKGFIRYSFKKYHERYLRTGGIGPVKLFIYNSNERENSLLLRIISTYGVPDLTTLGIRANNIDLPFLLSKLKGQLTADFSSLEVQNLEETGIKISPEKDYAQLGVLGLYLCQNSTPLSIQRAVLCRRKKKSRAPEHLKLEDTVIDDFATRILSEASKITITNSFYPESSSSLTKKYVPNSFRLFNPRFSEKVSIQERSDIFQPQRGKYLWGYNIWVTNNEGMPAYILPQLEELFEITRRRFNDKAFRNMKLQNPDEIFQGGLYG